jgi:exopolyphosphatase/guanosine-5'-triphosphate,3'-diphosphate pyrophosphatase
MGQGAVTARNGRPNGQGGGDQGGGDREFRARRSARNDTVFAAIDLGTNNCRLLVARPGGRDLQVIDAFSRIVRLGEGVGASGRLSEAAMARTLRALKVCAAKIDRPEIVHSRAVATAACRRAANCNDFLARVIAETGIDIEIISSAEEASLAFSSCLPLLDRRRRHALLFDIGGGSTEVGWVDLRPGGTRQPRRRQRPALRDWHSLPLGVSELAERYGGREVTPRTYERMVEEVRTALAGFMPAAELARLVDRDEIQMVGTSGTVTTLAGVHMDLPRYDRTAVDGRDLDLTTVTDTIGRITAMSYVGRRGHPCIGPARADLVIAGCAILEGIVRTWPVGRLRVADRGLREGILWRLMRRHGASGNGISLAASHGEPS